MNARKMMRDFIDEHLRKMQKQASYSDGDNIFKKRIVNSLFAMRLLKFMEEKFQISVTPEDLKPENFSSVDNMIRFIESK